MSDGRTRPGPAPDEVRAAVERSLGDKAERVGELVGRASGRWVVSGRCAAPLDIGGASAQTVLIAGGPGMDPDGRMLAPGPAAGAEDDGPGAPASFDAFCAVADALPEVGAVAVPAVLSDRVLRSAEGRCDAGTNVRLAALAFAFGATGKHLVVRVADPREAQTVAAMASAVADGVGQRREHPLVTVITGHGPPGTESAVAAAEAGLPQLVPTRPTPESIAEALTTIAVVQEQVPGAVSPVLLAWEPAKPLDTGSLSDVAYSVPAVRSFGVPLVAGVLSTGAEAPGWRSSAENTAAALIAWSAGADAVSGAGLLAAGTVFDATSLALDAEIASYVAATCAGIPVDGDALAVEVVERVGIGGNYLGERHTRRHMRGVWRPRFFDRSSLEQWKREGCLESVDLAAAFVQKTVDEPSVDPLDAPIAAELDRIVRDAAPA